MTGQARPGPVEGTVWWTRAVGDEGHGQRPPSQPSSPRPAGAGGAEMGGLCSSAESLAPPAPRGRQPGRPWGRVRVLPGPPPVGVSLGGPLDGGQPGGERQGLGAVSQAYPGGSWAAPTLALRPVGQRAPSSLLPPPDHQTLGPGYTGAQRLTGQDPTQALPPPGSAPVPSLAKRVTTLSRPLWAPVASLLVSPPPCVASEPLVKCVWGSHGRVAGAALVRSLTGRRRGAEPPGR